MKRLVATGAAVIALVVSGCGGNDEKATTTSPVPSDGVEAPSGGATPQGAVGSLPPEFLECMAGRGVDPADVHAPEAQGAFQACLGSLH